MTENMGKWPSGHRKTEKSGHRLAAEKTLFPRRWYGGYDLCKPGGHLGNVGWRDFRLESPLIHWGTMMPEKKISKSDIQTISDVLGDTDEGLTEAEVAEVLDVCRVKDDLTEGTKQQRLFKALSNQQSRDGHRRAILAVIRVAMNPERYAGDHEKFERRRVRLNEALLLCGLLVQQDGTLISSPSASSVWLDIGSEGLIKALWRGHVSLGTTFWLFGVMGRAVLYLPGMILKEYSSKIWEPISLPYVLVVYFGYGIFISIAIWRSAGNYNGDKFWVISARIYVVISLIWLVIVSLTGTITI